MAWVAELSQKVTDYLDTEGVMVMHERAFNRIDLKLQTVGKNIENQFQAIGANVKQLWSSFKLEKDSELFDVGDKNIEPIALESSTPLLHFSDDEDSEIANVKYEKVETVALENPTLCTETNSVTGLEKSSDFLNNSYSNDLKALSENPSETDSSIEGELFSTSDAYDFDDSNELMYNIKFSEKTTDQTYAVDYSDDEMHSHMCLKGIKIEELKLDDNFNSVYSDEELKPDENFAPILSDKVEKVPDNIFIPMLYINRDSFDPFESPSDKKSMFEARPVYTEEMFKQEMKERFGTSETLTKEQYLSEVESLRQCTPTSETSGFDFCDSDWEII